MIKAFVFVLVGFIFGNAIYLCFKKTLTKKKMSLQHDLDELNNINLEIRRLTNTIREFRKQKKVVEDRVIAFLKNQETQGVRYNDQAVILDNKNIRNKKKKKEKLDEIHSVLNKYGIKSSDTLIQEIMDAQRGSIESNECLKVVRRT
jgi:hypothetical protein